jgi:hypothetical protein
LKSLVKIHLQLYLKNKKYIINKKSEANYMCGELNWGGGDCIRWNLLIVGIRGCGDDCGCGYGGGYGGGYW